MPKLQLPRWVREYQRAYWSGDLLASGIVALLLIPQGMAYAQLAGLPPMVGLYASVGPLLIYGLLGTSMAQSVGPMAITSAMTAAALAPLAAPGSAHYLALAATLALLSGLLLMLFGGLRLGQITRILSLPVVQGFSAGTAVLIILGQLGTLVGSTWQGSTLPALLRQLPAAWSALNPISVFFGLAGLSLMWLAGSPAARGLVRAEVKNSSADLLSKVLPLVVLLTLSVVAVHLPQLNTIKTLGNLPAVSPELASFTFDISSLKQLALPALLIGLAGFLQSITVAQMVAAERHQTIDANRELVALGSCNIAAAGLGGMPVSGGFSRTMVNHHAGAQTPLAGILSALWIVLALAVLLPTLAHLPIALLAATIILASARMISLQQYLQAWRYDRRDGLAWGMTFVGVLLTGPMIGIGLGIAITLFLYLWRSQQPHIAVVGRIAGTEHYRNVLRHQVETHPQILALRIDENLYFANIAQILEQIDRHLSQRLQTQHVVLILSAVNSVDYSAVAALKHWQTQLASRGITVHLAEVKGPVLDTLSHGDLLQGLKYAPFISTHRAMQTLTPSENDDYSI